MFRTPRRYTIIVVTIALTLVSLAVVASANHAWGNYHWARTSNPFTLKVGDNVDSRWDAYLDEAIIDWNQSSVLDLTKVAGGTAPKSCRPTSGRIEACNARYGNTGWLGIAQIWASGSHITQAITKLNDTYFDTATYNTPAWRRLVTCQEIAHDFGLAHQDETFNNRNLGSCMDYTNAPSGGVLNGFDYGPSNEHPNTHDFNQLVTMYSHTDSSTTIGQSVNAMPPAANNMELDGPGQWGKEVHRSANGRVSIFEQDFGNGHKVITHVFWALEGPRGNRGGHDEHDEEQ